MAKRGIRTMLWIVIVAAAAITAYLFWVDETATRRDATAARTFDDSAHAAARALMDLRAAQQAYVASGQGSEFWQAKVRDTLAAARQALGAMRIARTEAAHAAIQNASATLEDFEQLDRRAREYVASGQLLMASDVIFSAGVELTESAWGDVQRARAAEQQAVAAGARAARQRQWTTLAAGAAATCLLALLLVPVPRAHPLAQAVASERDLAADEGRRSLRLKADATEAEGLDLHLLDREEPQSKAPVRSAAHASTPLPPATGSAAVPASVDFAGLASLCADLARVNDIRALQPILERAAALLEGAGIIVWIADPDGRELAPIVSHGYSPQLVLRLGTIAREAENVTAAAFRTGLLQTLQADAMSNGALAAPLVTPAGCVGVMAAEMRNGGEQQEERLAAATIVAAQLATLVGPPAARKAEAAGG